MVLDDETIVVERLKASLERAGFSVGAFSSSKHALERLKEEEFDILVTDIKMSSPDGMEVLRCAQEIRPGIKSVVITGFATRATAEEAKLSGAVEFIAKPFKIKQLKKLLIKLSEPDEETGK
jgi:DNA-binding NtrC family response regulator